MKSQAAALHPPAHDVQAKTQGFESISPPLLLAWETMPCDLFRRLDTGDFALLMGKGAELGERGIGRIRALGLTHLYIRQEDAPALFLALRETLGALVRDPAIPSEAKAELVHAVCREALRRVFADPRAAFIEQAGEVLVPTIDLILEDDGAARQMVRLTAYDHATYVHSTNVGIFSLALGRIFLGRFSVEELRRAGAGFFLHDLGKCLIPLEILNKPGPLTAAERLVVERHPQDGLKILEGSTLLSEEAATILLQHHERDDGSGYPFGLKGGDIHPFARICRLADVYEALTSHRPYHQRHTTFEALKVMKERAMSDADPDLLRRFIGLFSL